MKKSYLAGAMIASAIFAGAFTASAAYAGDIDIDGMVKNGSATTASDVLTVGNGTFSASSAFVPTPYATEGLSFAGSFDINLDRIGEGTGLQADGVSFIIQNDNKGTDAIGGGGGNIGAQNIQRALGVGFQSYDNNAAFIFTTSTFATAAAAAKGNFSLGGNATNLITVTFSYVNDLFKFQAVNATTGQTISNQLAFSLSSLGDQVYVGFTGGTGGAAALQTISNFKLTASNTTAVPGPEAGAGLGALALGGMAFWVKRRRKGDRLPA